MELTSFLFCVHKVGQKLVPEIIEKGYSVPKNYSILDDTVPVNIVVGQMSVQA